MSAHKPGVEHARIEAFVERLARAEVGSRVRNHYAQGCEGSTTRRSNLLLYLAEMAARRPSAMIVGEAPGHRGCRLTGVPFTSEAIVAQGVACGLFGSHKGYIVEGRGREQTASIVWGTLEQVSLVPLLWNAYPFHPFSEGDERTNRAPTLGEIKAGTRYLLDLASLFEIERVIAIGNRAALALHIAGIAIAGEKVRHPAHGGKVAFEEGLAALVGTQADATGCGEQLLPEYVTGQ